MLFFFFFHACFWRIFIIIQLKRSTSMSFKYNIDIEKDEKYWIQVLTLLSVLNIVIFFLLNSEKETKNKRGCSGPCRRLVDTCFSLNLRRLCCIFTSVCGARLLMQKWTLSVQVSHPYWSRGRSSEAREKESSLSYCPSCSLFTLCCRSSSALIGAVRSADSPCMADGGGGGAVGMLARSNQGNSSSLQHFWKTPFIVNVQPSSCKLAPSKGCRLTSHLFPQLSDGYN